MLSVELLRPVLRAAWGPDTCDPHDLESWRPDNPARGQCGVTALVVQDLLGGDLILGEVHVDGAKVGHHYWNRLPDGTEVDFTAAQFHPGEVVSGGRVQHRPPDAPRRCREQYVLLRRRVLAALTHAAGPGAGGQEDLRP
ncbi:YunG family protein [Microbispora sp. CA-102843]|uniref:YunG family protein n=1 Tax=Microbispora sp. CA-102843 TaxID=3239952 RepID=UPI003D8CBA72